MAVITIGQTGATWGLTAETGLLVQTHTSKDTREKNQVRDEQGDFALVSFYNPTQSVSVSGVMITATGVAAAAPGVVLVIANTNSANGVTTGGIYTDDVDVTKGNTEFKKLTANATRYKFA
tara:strand:+ start:1143 stop:1505 length:363 start_codon:yes stop_codon:yes gene_type:complete